MHLDILDEREFHIFDGIPCGVVLIDANHEIVWLNEEMESLFGVPKCTAIGMHALFFISACILPRIEEAERLGREYIRAFLEQSEVSVRRYRASSEDAKTRYIEYWGLWVSRGPLKGMRIEFYHQVKENTSGDDKGKLKDLLNREVRRNMDLARKIEEIEHQHHTIMENVCDIVWMADSDLRISYASPSISTILGWEANEVRGMLLDELFTEKSAGCARMMWDDMMRCGNENDTCSLPWKVELQARRRDGSTKWLEVNSVCINGDDGKPTGILGVSRDISERRRLEEIQRDAYWQIEKNIEQFAILNDQIRNPLQAIVGLADLQGGEIAEMICQQAGEIDEIIQKLDQGWVESMKIRSFLDKYFSSTVMPR